MQTIRWRTAFLALVAVTGAGLLGGCSSGGEPPTIDGAKLEQRIKEDASKTDLKLVKVDCPRNRIPKTDDRFSCTAAVDAGGSLVYEVVITSALGEYRYELAPGQVIDGAEVARLVTADIVAAGPAAADAKVTCPATIVAPEVRTVFDCTLTAAGSTARISVTSERNRPLDWEYEAP
jgi:hypothetical protein